MTESTEETSNPVVTKEPTAFEKASVTIAAAHSEGQNENEIVVALIQGDGLNFKIAGSFITRWLQENGFALSAKDRYTLVEEILVNHEFAPEEWSDVVSKANFLVETIGDTNQKQALNSIRKFAKEHEIELPKKQKGSGLGTTGFRAQSFDWMVENIDATEAELLEFLTVNEKSDNLKKRMTSIFVLGKRMVEASRTDEE
jgi:hypothetical protein